jgi:CO/xanthine dehydrogenase Mo-binding subunit
LASVEGAQVVTIEGLAGGMFHPLQKHWVQEQVPQCGYCQPGTIMQAAALLAKNPDPTDEEILKGMNSIVCRCMTYDRMKEAIKGAASEMRSGDGSVPAASPGGTDRVVFERQASDAAPNGSGHRIQTLWFEMEPTGLTTVNVSKTEIGQHVGTALAQALAEELEVRWEDVRVRYASSAPEWGLMITGGSWSINWTFDQMSSVGAAGRIALIEAGARLLGVDPAQCKAEESRIVNISTGGAVSYGEILQKVEVSLNLEENALKQIVLKKPEAYKLVGRSVAALDIPGKVDGSAEYTIDVVRPGMVYGHPVMPPVRCGAKVLNVDPSEARKLPGFIDYVLIDDPNGDSTGFVVAVAESYPAAMEAAKALKVEWDLGPNADVDSAALREAAAALAEHPVNVGNWVLDGEADKYYPVGSGEPSNWRQCWAG